MSFLLTLALAFVGARIHRYRRSTGQHIVGPQIGSDIKILSKFFAVGLPRFKALDGRTGLGIDVAEIGEFIIETRAKEGSNVRVKASGIEVGTFYTDFPKVTPLVPCNFAHS